MAYGYKFIVTQNLPLEKGFKLLVAADYGWCFDSGASSGTIVVPNLRQASINTAGKCQWTKVSKKSSEIVL